MEPTKHAIERIIKEEIGIKIKNSKHLGLIEYFNDEGRHTVSNGYLAEIKSGAPKGSKQGKKIKFFKKIPRVIILTPSYSFSSNKC